MNDDRVSEDDIRVIPGLIILDMAMIGMIVLCHFLENKQVYFAMSMLFFFLFFGQMYLCQIGKKRSQRDGNQKAMRLYFIHTVVVFIGVIAVQFYNYFYVYKELQEKVS